jgi:hypothetical protein
MSGRGYGIRVARGFGLGAVTIPVMAAAYVGLDKPQVAHASVLTRTTQQIGGSFGTAVLAVVLEVPWRLIPATPPPGSTSPSGGPPGSPHSPCCSHDYFQANTVRCWKHEPEGPRRHRQHGPAPLRAAQTLPASQVPKATPVVDSDGRTEHPPESCAIHRTSRAIFGDPRPLHDHGA